MMKITNKILAVILILNVSSKAVTTLAGTIGSSFKDETGASNIPTGSLVFLIADTGAAGFLSSSTQGAVEPGTAGLTGKTLAAAQMGITVGSLFGDDVIFATGVSGSSGSIPGFSNFDPAPALNRNFAIVWFTQTAAALGLNSVGARFGMISLADWVMPGDADSKSYILSPNDAFGSASFYSVPSATTAAQLGAGGFFTGSGTAADSGSTAVRAATFTVVPEPSTAVLGTLGALALLRRRRN